MSKYRNAYCSFCRKSYRDVGPLVEGPGDVYICGDCIELCQSIIEQEKRRRGLSLECAIPQSPDEIRARLGKFVSGQLAAKQALAAAVHRHYARLSAGSGEHVAGRAEDSTILLLGPSPACKLLFARALAHIMGVPFVHADAVSLKEVNPGPLGIGQPLFDLLQASQFDIQAAQRGIMYLDGVDQPDVQPALYSLLARPISVLQERLNLDTSNILFLCGGRFPESNPLMSGPRFQARDLVSLGLAPELVDHFGVIVWLDPLDEATLVRLSALVDLKGLSREVTG